MTKASSFHVLEHVSVQNHPMHLGPGLTLMKCFSVVGGVGLRNTRTPS